MLPWKRGDLPAALGRPQIRVYCDRCGSLVTLAVTGARALGAACGLALAAWLMAATLTELAERVRLFAEPLPVVLRRAIHLPRASWGWFSPCRDGGGDRRDHRSTAWTEEKDRQRRPGQSFEIAGLRNRTRSGQRGRRPRLYRDARRHAPIARRA